MIDYLTLALTHGLMALALWRLLFRPDLDVDLDVGASGNGPAPRARPWVRKPSPPAETAPDA
jgi:hypothetical protein